PPPCSASPTHDVLSRLLSSRHGDPRDLHSFPTRRSSDLSGAGWKGRARPAPNTAPRPAMPARCPRCGRPDRGQRAGIAGRGAVRSEEHTSELQSLTNLVCRLLLEKKKNSKRSPLKT